MLRQWLTCLVLVVFIASSANGMAAKPKPKKEKPPQKVEKTEKKEKHIFDMIKKRKKKKKDKSKKKGKQETTAPEVTPTPNATEKVTISDEELEKIEDQKRKMSKLLKLKQFDKVTTIIDSIPPSQLSASELEMKSKLDMFKSINVLEKENNSLFSKDESMDPAEQKTVIRLYKAAQMALINDQPDLAKDMLIQTLYIDRQNFKAKKLLEKGLGLKLGQYKVVNVEKKYWETSLISMRSGYPERAVQQLQVLENFDPQNPTIFERMGSAYYVMGKTTDAITAWRRALYLNPKNKDLEKFIANAKVEVERQKKMVQEELEKSKQRETATVDADVEMQVLGVYANANQAYSYAAEVEKARPGVKTVVEEMANGKYAVKIPKPKPKKEKK